MGNNTSRNPYMSSNLRRTLGNLWSAPSEYDRALEGIQRTYYSLKNEKLIQFQKMIEELKRRRQDSMITDQEYQKLIGELRRTATQEFSTLYSETSRLMTELDLKKGMGEVSTRRVSLAARVIRSLDAALNAANKLLTVYGTFQSMKGVFDRVRGADVVYAQQQLEYAQQQAQALPSPQQLYEAARDGKLSEERLQQLMERIQKLEKALDQIAPTLEAISATINVNSQYSNNVNSQYSNATQTATQPTPTQPSESTATFRQAENSTYQKPENNKDQKATQATAVAVIAALALSLFLFTSRSTMMAAAAIPKTPLVIGLSLILVISIGALLRIKR